MSFAREGLTFILVAAGIAAGTFFVALNRRSWPIWLLAFVLTLVALSVAYFFRDSATITYSHDGVAVQQGERMSVIRLGLSA